MKRQYYLSQVDAQQVIDACPDDEWRLLIALARYGGLRVPSEVILLRWQDIDWAKSRFTVTSPKTEHHKEHESRLVPIFPELLSYLQDSFEMASPNDEFCIMRYRDNTCNLRTQFNRIIKRAGLTPWPKLWQNLRSTRETELADHFPLQVVTAWIGNSAPVAIKHYLQVTKEHFNKAARNQAQKLPESPRSDKKHEAINIHESDITIAIFRSLHKKTASCEKQETVNNGPYRT